MSRESELLAALTSEPTSTSDVYERIGYMTLTRLGLIPYPAFRQALGQLAAAGLAEHETAADGSTVWWIAAGSPNGESPNAELRNDEPNADSQN